MERGEERLRDNLVMFSFVAQGREEVSRNQDETNDDGCHKNDKDGREEEGERKTKKATTKKHFRSHIGPQLGVS